MASMGDLYQTRVQTSLILSPVVTSSRSAYSVQQYPLPRPRASQCRPIYRVHTSSPVAGLLAGSAQSIQLLHVPGRSFSGPDDGHNGFVMHLINVPVG